MVQLLIAVLAFVTGAAVGSGVTPWWFVVFVILLPAVLVVAVLYVVAGRVTIVERRER